MSNHPNRLRSIQHLANLRTGRSSLAMILLGCCTSASLARTVIDSSAAQCDVKVSNVFHREFDGGSVKPDERLVVLICPSDGATVSVNGHEVGRVNLPDGTVDANTLSLVPDPKEKGLYYRMRVPADLIHAGKNTIDAEVHSEIATGSALSCDLELKTLPALQTQPPLNDAAKKVLEEFRRESYIPAGTLIPDGYIDGGHAMRLDAGDHATSGREILVVDRPMDAELQKELAFADTLKAQDPVTAAHRLSLYVDKLTTPPGGRQTLGETVDLIQKEFENQPLCIGDVVDQCQAGVCRHRSLLFKLLADEAGLKVALVRGNYFHAGHGDAHAWNELLLADGRRLLVDTTQHPKDEFPDITSPEVTPVTVAHHYVKLDNTPYYTSR